jgi:hypothetical protein
VHGEERGIDQPEGRWPNEEGMTPGRGRHRPRNRNDDAAGVQRGSDRDRDGGDRDVENLDYARRHTTVSDGKEEGYGRSEGQGRRRLGQTSQYGADDDDLQYGRNLGPRDRIPGAGSRRNR